MSFAILYIKIQCRGLNTASMFVLPMNFLLKMDIYIIQIQSLL